MKPEQKSLRLGAGAIVCALLLRLLAAIVPGNMVQAISDATPAILFAETGRTVQDANSPTAETVIHIPVAPQPDQPVFSAQDAALLKLNNTTASKPDLETLLTQPLSLSLYGQDPKVLILHTHTCESYTGSATESGYRSTDPAQNMTCLGAALSQMLEQAGIEVIHDQTVHDGASYNGSYASARETLEKHLAQDPQISLVLDLHRDAIQNSDGSQKAATVTLSGKSTAQLMLVVGGGSSYQVQPNWQENLALAAKLQVSLEQLAPGLCRPICLRPYCYNQDLSPGALIVEVGTAGNTMDEAREAVAYLAQAIIQLANGTPGP